MSNTFRNITDENGVTSSWNSRPDADYGPSPVDTRPGFAHLMHGPTGPYIDPAPCDIIHETKDRVLMQSGRPGVTMSFTGDLLPRADRLQSRDDSDEKGR